MARASRLMILALAFVFAANQGFAEEKEVTQENDWLPGTISGNVAFVTDYHFRGVSQTQEGPALQGGIDWNHDSGFFLGTWASSIKFADDDSFLEWDVYGGYGGSIGKFTYSAGAYFFYYPKEEQFNYWEFALNTGYDFGPFSMSAGVLWSPDYFGVLNDGVYVSTGISVPLPIEVVDLTLDANVGYTKTDLDIFDSDNYVDWNVGLGIGIIKGLALDLRYVDTDVSGVDDADTRFIASISYAF